MEDKIAIGVCQKFERLQTARKMWEAQWQDIRDYVRPYAQDFQRNSVPGERRNNQIVDGTAVNALEELASALHSFLTNPVDRWFELGIHDMPEAQNDPAAMLWLEFISELIYAEYNKPEVNFNTAIHEVYLDIGGFGTGNLYQFWSDKTSTVKFMAFSLSETFIDEDTEGNVDTVYRSLTYTTRQVAQMWKKLPKKLAEIVEKDKTGDKTVNIIHAVHPRTDRNPAYNNAVNKPFASCWVCKTTKETLDESGYDELPYAVSRWSKMAQERYGRSPAMKCLPDIKMLNRMEFTLLKAAQKMTDPPNVIPNEGYLLPLKTSPDSVIYKEPGAEAIQTLEFKGNIPVGMDMCDQKREFIGKCFYADWIKMEKTNKEMTAYEVQDRREEKLRLMSPMLGRQHSELLGPMLARTYNLMSAHGRIPRAPRALQGKTLKVEYISPASRAQMGVRATGMMRYVQELLPLVQIKPDIIDVIDFDKLAKQMAIARGTSRTIIRPDDEMVQIRQDRAQQQQMQQMAQVAEPATKAIKNLADANSQGAGL